MTMVYILGAFPKVSETFIAGEIAALRRQGIDVTVFSLRRSKDKGPVQPEAETLLPYTRYLPSGRLRFVRLARAVMTVFSEQPGTAMRCLWWATHRAMRGNNSGELLRFAQAAYISKSLPSSAEHLHAHFAHGPATCAAMVSRLSGVPYSFTAHARDIFEYGDNKAVHDKVAAAQSVIAISKHGSDRVIELAGAELAERVEVVHNGIDLDVFRRRPQEPTGVPTILCVARLVEKKGQDTLLRAIAMLARDGRQVRCELVGDGPEREHLETTADWLGIRELVTFHGALDATDVLSAYRTASVFALPCRVDANGDQDGLPVSLVEAMAVGVPVVSTHISGIPELIQDGTSGLLVDPYDARALANAIAVVLDDADLRHSLTDAARAVAETYDREQTTRRFIEVTAISLPQQRTPAEVLDRAS
jgi:glycosyltransferase involved in cell wall biosynthesis